MRRPRLFFASVAVALVVSSGCSSSRSDAAQRPVATSSTPVVQPPMTEERPLGRWGDRPGTRSAEIVMYLIEPGSRLLRPVPVPVEPAKASTPGDRGVAGVAALLAADESGDRFASFWGRMCGLATGVESVEPPADSAPVIVRLTGQGGALCDLTRPANVLREQQLAWTAVDNLGIDPATPVRVLGPGGRKLFSDLAPDRAYVSG